MVTPTFGCSLNLGTRTISLPSLDWAQAPAMSAGPAAITVDASRTAPMDIIQAFMCSPLSCLSGGRDLHPRHVRA
ncbi:hypothetical protein C7I55_21575 [Sphingomonas deserti]|uniref:Uncharacterized protein n=1 Tax=Allosphingosinicella deserti TaxID=2116704 RepID=A0A2P7QI62_9SPHN|nr:hypothetical protein C7I55_21575 [Sphingomonas deserti]